MNSFESGKNYASIGSVLLFLSFIPFVGIIGLILVYLGMKEFSGYYNEPSIHQDTFKGFIWGIIALVVTAVGVLFAFIVFIPTLGIGSVLIILALAVVDFVFYLLMAMNFRKAFTLLAQRSGEHSFETAGNLLLWGAILTIAFGIGLILIFIAWIFATIGFFSIKTTNQPTQTYGYNTPPPPPPPTMTSQAQRYCPNCGAPVAANATFCPNCGKQLNA